MVIAIILIGGSGYRFCSAVPKQFAKIRNKDIFVYTTEVFQNNVNIDEIAIAYPKGWKGYIVEQCKKFKLLKVKNLVEGGKTRQESGFHVVKHLMDQKNENPIIVEHDGDRVFVDDNIINNCIDSCKIKGNAWACINSSDYIVEGTQENIIGNLKTKIKRQTLRTHTPCAFYLKDLYKIYKYCDDNKINDMCIACDIALDLGIKVHPVSSTTKNGIKLVTQEDFEIIKMIIENGQR